MLRSCFYRSLAFLFALQNGRYVNLVTPLGRFLCFGHFSVKISISDGVSKENTGLFRLLLFDLVIAKIVHFDNKTCFANGGVESF